MIKQLLTATLFCLSLSACNDSSSDSSPNEPLETLAFTSVAEAVSLARVETSNGQGSHLIGFDANGAPLGDLSNYDVDKFTPTSDGGFVVEVTENHKSTYQYQNLGDSVDQHEPITHTYRKPVWYYVQTSDSEDGSINAGDYFLISDKKELPEFVGENSNGLLVFSDGETFDTTKYTRSRFYNNIDIDQESLINAISQITNENSTESIKEILQSLVESNTIEKTDSVSMMSGDSLLSESNSLGTVLLQTTDYSSQLLLTTACNQFDDQNKNEACLQAIKSIQSVIKISADNSDNVAEILPIPNSEYTLIGQNIGLLSISTLGKPQINKDSTNSGNWDGESSLGKDSAFVLSRTQNGQDCQDENKQCLYSIGATTSGIPKKTTVTSDFIIDANTGFETDSQAGQIEGGQQNYLWVNDDYIVIKEARQISIIDRKDSNTLLAPILVDTDTEIDTINLTKDSKLYITATNFPNLPAAYIYDIVTKKMSSDISNGEKLHALKALIK